MGEKNLENSGPVQISCRRSKYNHHKGQTYSDFSPDHLVSKGWKHRKSCGDYFTLNASSKVSMTGLVLQTVLLF